MKPDDVVIWVPSEFSGKVVGAAEDERFGWVGFIRAKLAPEMDSNGDLKITCRYD